MTLSDLLLQESVGPQTPSSAASALKPSNASAGAAGISPGANAKERANLVGYLLAGIVDGSLDKLLVSMPGEAPDRSVDTAASSITNSLPQQQAAQQMQQKAGTEGDREQQPAGAESGVNAKARSNLLAGLKDGSLNKLVSTMPGQEEPAADSSASKPAAVPQQPAAQKTQQKAGTEGDREQQPTGAESGVNAKARSNLLAGLKDGSLDKLVSSMPGEEEPAADSSASKPAAVPQQPAAQKTQQKAGTGDDREQQPAGAESGVNAKARSNLLAGLKDGSLDKLVSTMPGQEEPAADGSVSKPAAAVGDGKQQPAGAESGVNAKARSNLLAGLKDGSLDKLVSTMPGQEEPAADSSASNSAAVPQQPAAQKTQQKAGTGGDREQQPAGAESGVNAKARSNLLAGLKDGSLNKLVSTMPGEEEPAADSSASKPAAVPQQPAAQKTQQKAGTGGDREQQPAGAESGVNAKARSNLLAGLKDGSLNKLVSTMPGEEEPAADSSASKPAAVPQQPAAQKTQQKAGTGGDREQQPAGAESGVNAKARSNLLAGLKDGSLNKLVSTMPGEEEPAADSSASKPAAVPQQPAAQKTQQKAGTGGDREQQPAGAESGVNAKARSNLLAGLKDGSLNKLVSTMPGEEEPAADSSASKPAAVPQQPAAQKTQQKAGTGGDREQQPAGAESGVNAKARSNLLAGLKDGSLNKLVSTMPGEEEPAADSSASKPAAVPQQPAAQKTQQKAGTGGDREQQPAGAESGVNAKARSNLLAGLKDGSLNKLVSTMPGEEEPAADSSASKPAAVPQQPAAQKTQQKAGTGGDREQQPAGAESGVNAKARSNLLAGLKDGSLNKLVSTMPGEEEPAADSSASKPAAVPQQPAAQKTQQKAGTGGDREQQPAGAESGVNAKARSNLLAGLKDGSLDKLVSTMPAQKESSAHGSVSKPATAVPQQAAAKEMQQEAGAWGNEFVSIVLSRYLAKNTLKSKSVSFAVRASMNSQFGRSSAH